MGGSRAGTLSFINPQGTHLYTMCTVSMNNIFVQWHRMSVTERVEHLLPVAYVIGLSQHSRSNGHKSHVFNMFFMLWAW